MHQGELHKKGSALVFGCCKIDGPIATIHDVPYDRESQAGAGVFGGKIGVEDLVFHWLRSVPEALYVGRKLKHGKSRPVRDEISGCESSTHILSLTGCELKPFGLL